MLIYSVNSGTNVQRCSIPMINMFLDDSCILVSIQKLICQRKQSENQTVELVSVHEQVQAQFQTHTIVTFVISKLNISDNLL